MEVLGLFASLDDASAAVEKLLRAGFPEERVTSLSSIPYPEGVLVGSGPPARLGRWSLGGGAIGAVAGFLLAAGTAWLYPVQTGEKAIIAPFPVGIITYELTMLLATVGTFAGMLFGMKLPDLHRHAYDPGIADGLIGILVTAEREDERRRAGELLTEAGALRLRTEEATA